MTRAGRQMPDVVKGLFAATEAFRNGRQTAAVAGVLRAIPDALHQGDPAVSTGLFDLYARNSDIRLRRDSATRCIRRIRSIHGRDAVPAAGELVDVVDNNGARLKHLHYEVFGASWWLLMAAATPFLQSDLAFYGFLVSHPHGSRDRSSCAVVCLRVRGRRLRLDMWADDGQWINSYTVTYVTAVKRSAPSVMRMHSDNVKYTAAKEAAANAAAANAAAQAKAAAPAKPAGTSVTGSIQMTVTSSSVGSFKLKFPSA